MKLEQKPALGANAFTLSRFNGKDAAVIQGLFMFKIEFSAEAILQPSNSPKDARTLCVLQS